MTAALRLIRRAELVAQPWANGAGQTVTVAQSPTGARPDAVDWRVSIAEVTGPSAFSDFSGYTRWFASLEPDGILLCVGDDVHRLGRWEPVEFSGALPAHAEPARVPAKDLNLMVGDAVGTGAMRRRDLPAGERLDLDASDTPDIGWCALIVLEGAPQLVVPGQDRVTLAELDAVAVSASAVPESAPAAIIGPAVLMELRVTPLAQAQTA